MSTRRAQLECPTDRKHTATQGVQVASGSPRIAKCPVCFTEWQLFYTEGEQ